MCGIFGVSGKTSASYKNTEIEAAIAALSKRGPDDHAAALFPGCTLGQTRLSIVDLAGGHQPMKDNARDLTITFNGEIYNYLDLKASLSTKGHKFSTHSDTEVILKAYIEYGKDCPKYFDGMFAFAIWDDTKKELFLARDRFGKKPLYYTFDKDGNFLFASEIKALFETGKIKGEVDPEAIDNYLTLMYIPPWRTVYKNIKVLPPASSAVVKEGETYITSYWKLEKRPAEKSHIPTYEEAKEQVRKLLTESVKKRMIADVEIGSFLSGGIDSTLVTLLAQKFSKTPIKTFSLGYQDYINELPFALEASKKIGSDHYPLQAKDDDIAELHRVMNYFDEPHADSSDFPQHLVSKHARSKVKVALSGDGADELFLGYGWYTRHKNLSYRAHFFEKVFMSPFNGFIKAIRVFSAKERSRLWKDPGVFQSFSRQSFIPEAVKHSSLSSAEKINLFDLTTYLPGQLLVKADRMAMMNSLEVRSPFLDHHLAEYVYNLPEEFKTDKQNFKIILKDILSEYMPKEFVYRRKQGFGAPVKAWLKKESFKKDIYAKLVRSNAFIYQILNEKAVVQIVNDFYTKGKDDQHYKIWVLYCLELWFEAHQKYHV